MPAAACTDSPWLAALLFPTLATTGMLTDEGRGGDLFGEDTR